MEICLTDPSALENCLKCSNVNFYLVHSTDVEQLLRFKYVVRLFALGRKNVELYNCILIPGYLSYCPYALHDWKMRMMKQISILCPRQTWVRRPLKTHVKLLNGTLHPILRAVICDVKKIALRKKAINTGHFLPVGNLCQKSWAPKWLLMNFTLMCPPGKSWHAHRSFVDLRWFK